MKTKSALPFFFALLVLFLASLACAAIAPQATNAPAPTDAPAAALVATNAPAATPVPEPTATPKPTRGEIVLEENFADNKNNWYVGQDADGENQIEDGKYKVTLTTFGNYYWFEAPVSISEADLTVDTEFVAGAPENMAYGFLCHFKDKDNIYRAMIAPDGYYRIDKKLNGEFPDTNLQGWNFSSVIKTGVGALNQIRVVCSENHVTLYVNEVLLSDVVDTDLSGGTFTLFVSSTENKEGDKNPVTVNFSNLVVRKALPWQAPIENLLTDSFDNNQSDWSVYVEENKASSELKAGQLLLKVLETDSYYTSYPGLTLSNVDLTFEATALEGTEKNISYGAVCRYVNHDNRYIFYVAPDGQYSLGKRVAGEFTSLAEWAPNSAIKTGLGETNRLRVICSGPNLELYVNDKLVISVQDTSLTAGGFALQAGRFTDDTKPVAVAFDNVEVRYPEK